LIDQQRLRVALEPQAGIVRVGRAMDNDVVLASPRVSRYHAQLRWLESKWLMYDLDSTNGSWVDDERVTRSRPRAIEPDSTVRLGDHQLQVTTDEPARGRD
jgi:pSer/pThr/pTyr-binding forkhead associated (FHA) protein